MTVHVCDKSLCDNKICLADPKAICRVDPCGGCRHAFYDVNGKQVDCYAGLSSCQLEVQAVLNSATWAKQGGPWNVVRPASSSTGPYYDQTWYASAFSVPDDVEILTEAEALALSSSAPSAAARLRRQTEAEADLTETATDAPEEATPVVPEDATDLFEEVTQMDALLAEAVEEMVTVESATDDSIIVVEEETTEAATEDPVTQSRFAKLLDEGLTDVPNEFEADDLESINVEVDLDAIEWDAELAAAGEGPVSSTQRIMPALRDAIKPGFCPPPARSRTFLRVLAQFAGGAACADQCFSDADCPGSTRCCPGECGAGCVSPVLLPTPLLPKRGVCPSPIFPNGCPAGQSTPDDASVSQCRVDADCAGQAKCCSDGCISTCTSPKRMFFSLIVFFYIFFKLVRTNRNEPNET